LVSGPLSDDISEVLSETLADGRERGFFIFKDGNKITRTETKVGTKKSVMLNTLWPIPFIGPSGTPIATVHTHPDVKFDYLFSLTDIQSLIENHFNFSVVAYEKNGLQFAEVFAPMEIADFDDLKVITSKRTFPSGTPSTIEGRDLIRFTSNANEILDLCKVRI